MHVKIFFLSMRKTTNMKYKDRVCASYLTHVMFDEQSETMCLRHKQTSILQLTCVQSRPT